MTYEFTTNKVGSMKLKDFHGTTGNTLRLEGIDATISDANIIIGSVLDETLTDQIRLTVIATGFDDRDRSENPAANKLNSAQNGPGLLNSVQEKQDKEPVAPRWGSSSTGSYPSGRSSEADRKEEANTGYAGTRSGNAASDTARNNDYDNELTVPPWLRGKNKDN